MATPQHYVDNEQFLQEIIKWKEQKAIDPGTPLTDSIGLTFVRIATHFTNRHNFRNYPFREDMIANAVERCINKANNFDETISSNPFAYFTQIIYFSCIQTIRTEKTSLYAKIQLTRDMTQSLIFNGEDNPQIDSEISNLINNVDLFSPDIEFKFLEKATKHISELDAKFPKRKRSNIIPLHTPLDELFACSMA